MLAFVLRYRDRVYYGELNNGQPVTFGSGKKDTVQIREMSEEQICIRGIGEQIAMQLRAPFLPRQENISCLLYTSPSPRD